MRKKSATNDLMFPILFWFSMYLKGVACIMLDKSKNNTKTNSYNLLQKDSRFFLPGGNDIQGQQPLQAQRRSLNRCKVHSTSMYIMFTNFLTEMVLCFKLYVQYFVMFANVPGGRYILGHMINRRIIFLLLDNQYFQCDLFYIRHHKTKKYETIN